jgi:hypothetical protein
MRRFPTERVFDEVQIFEDLPVEIRKASHFTRARIALHAPEPLYTSGLTIGVARPRRRAPPFLSENRHRPCCGPSE